MYKRLLIIKLLTVTTLATGQIEADSSRINDKTTGSEKTPSKHTQNSGLFQSFGGGMSTLFSNGNTSSGFDLSAQAYHYFLVTGKRSKNDSIHSSLVKAKRPLREVYNGFHFYLLSRALLNFDTLQSIANNYVTSLLASPFTLRIKREFFLSKQHKISTNNFAPILSLIIKGDGRAIPFGEPGTKLNLGASGHFYISFSALFKRIEMDHLGKEIDRGTMSFTPTFGIAYGTKELMKSVSINRKKEPILTSGCRLGFNSEKTSGKDFSFLVQYTISDIIGPKLRAGVILTSIN